MEFQNILPSQKRAINRTCQEQDANLGEGDASSQQATKERKKTLTYQECTSFGAVRLHTIQTTSFSHESPASVIISKERDHY